MMVRYFPSVHYWWNMEMVHLKFTTITFIDQSPTQAILGAIFASSKAMEYSKAT